KLTVKQKVLYSYLVYILLFRILLSANLCMSVGTESRKAGTSCACPFVCFGINPVSDCSSVPLQPGTFSLLYLHIRLPCPACSVHTCLSCCASSAYHPAAF